MSKSVEKNQQQRIGNNPCGRPREVLKIFSKRPFVLVSVAGALAVSMVIYGCGGGGSQVVATPPLQNPAPSVTSLSPVSAMLSTPNLTLTINGSNFLASSTVTFNGVAHTPSLVSSSQLTVPLSATDLGTAGSYPVGVTNPSPGGGVSNTVAFTVNNLVPAITNVSPAFAAPGAAAQTLTINGNNFLSTSTVTYNGVAHASTFTNSTQLSIVLTANDLTVGGTYPIVVTNPPPGGGSSNSLGFLVAVISGPAYQTLTARVTANRSAFCVYEDQDSGCNHGFPSGLFTGYGASQVSVDAGCVDDPADIAIGCHPSTDTTALDQEHGTVLRLTFPPESGIQFTGINIEEPQNWGALIAKGQCGVTTTCNPYDLSGATNVEFDVRSPNGITLQFGVGSVPAGGCATPFMTIPASTTYAHISLALNSSSLSCTPALSSVNVLFFVVTNAANAPGGGTVLLDNIQFTPAPSRASQGNGTLSLPLSTQTYGVVPQTSAPFPPDQVNRNIASTYEASLTLISLLRSGQPGDATNALKIADALDYALHNENQGDRLPVALDGSAGLHDAYESGDIALLNDQQGIGAAKAGNVRLAGFTCGPTSPTGFCLISDGATGGNNAFAILALVAAYQQSGKAVYLNDALTIGNWIAGNLTDSTGSGYGGYYSGFFGLADNRQGVLNQGKSTENNADIFAAFSALDAVESQLGDANAASVWVNRANAAGDFVMAMFDSANGRFNAGTVPSGTTPPCPGGSQQGSDIINTCDFLDADTFPILAMAAAPRYGRQIDWTRPVQYVLNLASPNSFSQEVTAGSQTFSGFNLVPSLPPTGIAWEFTGQMVEACAALDTTLGVATFQSCAQTHLTQIRQAQTMAPFGDGKGIVASTLQNGDTVAPLGQCLSTPFQCIPERIGLAATNWAIFAELKFTPFH